MTSTQRGNRDLIRAINRSIILNRIKSQGPISRAEIARVTGLSPATVTGISSDLIDENLVFEKSAGDSSGGRPPILLALNPTGGYVVGIKLTETQVIGALTDLMASVIAKETLPLPGHDPDEVGTAIAGLVNRLLKTGRIRHKQLLGVGIGLAGVVDSQNGLLRYSPFLGWKDLPLRDMLQSRLRVPVYVDNDVNTLTLSEKWFGAGQPYDNFLTLTIGRGLGLGIVVNGQLYRGKSGGAGEFGHTLVDPDGPLCNCGRKGCLEAYVSDSGLLRSAQEAAGRGELPCAPQTVEELMSMAKAGEAGAQAVFTAAGVRLGRAVANLINLLDPEVILISGEGARYGEWLFPSMRQTVDTCVVRGLTGDTDVRSHTWGDDAWARGAASLVLGELFRSPVHQPGLDGSVLPARMEA